MRSYIPIDGTVRQTVFSVSSNCCEKVDKLIDVQANIYSKGGGPMLLSYPAHKICDETVTFQWDNKFYELKAGWYILEIRTHGCRSCGQHTVRIGKDCYTNWKNNVVSETVIECGKEVPTKTTNYG